MIAMHGICQLKNMVKCFSPSPGGRGRGLDNETEPVAVFQFSELSCLEKCLAGLKWRWVISEFRALQTLSILPVAMSFISLHTWGNWFNAAQFLGEMARSVIGQRLNFVDWNTWNELTTFSGSVFFTHINDRNVATTHVRHRISTHYVDILSIYINTCRFLDQSVKRSFSMQSHPSPHYRDLLSLLSLQNFAH